MHDGSKSAPGHVRRIALALILSVSGLHPAFAGPVPAAGPLPEATHVLTWGYDGYSTNLPLEEALKPDVLLAHAVDGAPLSAEHGGPVRVVTPQLYAWKGAKWVSKLEFMSHDQRGYWEIRGYSNTAWPWRNDRSW